MDLTSRHAVPLTDPYDDAASQSFVARWATPTAPPEQRWLSACANFLHAQRIGGVST